MIGVTVGINTIDGATGYELGNNFQSWSLGVEVLLFHPSWFTVAGNFSKSINSEQKMTESDGYSMVWEGSAWYIDLLAGARHDTRSGAFFWAGAGITVAGGEFGFTQTDSDGDTRSLSPDVPTTAGFVVGLGGAMPVDDRWLVFLKFRYRMVPVTSDLTIPGDNDVYEYDYGLGGMETAVGFGYAF